MKRLSWWSAFLVCTLLWDWSFAVLVLSVSGAVVMTVVVSQGWEREK
jgi:hypothetical protein